MHKLTRNAALLLMGLPFCSLAAEADFTLRSPQIADGATLTNQQVYNGFGCSGQNLSPALQWQGAPAGTKS